jgi:hypothetical protein
MAAADDRQFMARKLWGRALTGWSRPHWRMSKQDQSIMAYWKKHGHVEESDHMIRLTDAGREALTKSSS